VLTVVLSVMASLPETGSVVALATVAVLTNVSVVALLTITEMTTEVVTPLVSVFRSQVTVLPASAQPGAEEKVTPAGSVSVTTTSTASEGPSLVMVSV